jgi:cytochrome c-type biogenesis protein CcmH
VLSTLTVFLVAALLTAAAAFWGMRAYREQGARSPTPVLVLSVLVGLGALAAYLATGRPGLPGAPYSARLEALKQRDPASYKLGEALAILAEAGRERPRDPLPFLYTGELLLDQGRPQEAARAFDTALRREPQLAEAMMGLARSLVRIEDGRVTPEALALFQQASALTEDPAPWIYQAMAAMQEDRAADARRFWGEAHARMAPDDPRREMARRMSSETGR